MKIGSLQPLRNKYIHIAYISIIAALLFWATVGPSVLQAAAQDDDTRVLEVLCNSYGEGVDVNREGRTERISFREWLAEQRPGLVDLFNDVGCINVSAAVTGGEFFGTGVAIDGPNEPPLAVEPFSDCAPDLQIY